MSQDVPKLRQSARLKHIAQNILFKTQEEIAKDCGVDRKTIQRDIEKWKQKGGFSRFLIKEFFELYGKERHINPSKALDRIMWMLARYGAFDTITKARRNKSVTTLLRKYREIIEEETIIETRNTE